MPDPIARLNAALQGRYVIERELGQGGMATVYLADDLKHERKVALKVLKRELAAVVGADRFLAEIKTTANLQHPHILPLFDSGEADGFLFYVMPYIDGETLADRLTRDRQLPVDEAARIASDVAEALHAAHEQGVIHRDVKPANILLTKGRPLVADFGIALAVSAAGGGRLTETGLSLGTPYYMSPEQASADREPTAASDVYSLGCVLYEMLVGDPPYTGSSAQAVLTRILTESARAPSTIRPTIPANIDAAIRKSLEKLPADRFSGAQGFARALADPGFRYGDSPGIGVSAVPVWRRILWPALALVMAGIAAWSWIGPRESPRPVVRLNVLGADASNAGPGSVFSPAISRDGNQVAFIHTGTDGRAALSVRSLDSFESRLIVSSDIISAVSFSPDALSLAYHDGLAVRTIPITEGVGGSQVVAESADLTNPRFVRWENDGFIYFNDTSNNLARVPASGGTPQRLATVGADGLTLTAAMVIPGQDAAFVDISGGRFGSRSSFGVLDFGTGAVDTLGAGGSARIIDDDLMIWVESGTLYGQRFDFTRRAGVGTILALAEGIPSNEYHDLFDVSANGTLIYQVAKPGQYDLVSVSRSGVRVDRQQVTGNIGFRMDPQRNRIAFEEIVGELSDIWVLDLGSGTRSRITFGSAAFYPSWNLDGTRVAYYVVTDGVYDLYWKNADGSGVEEPLLLGPGREIEVAFVPGGNRMVVRQGDRARSDDSDIFLYDIGDPESGRPIAAGAGNDVSPMVSPDGKYVAYVSDELGAWQVFVRSIDNPAEMHQISIGGGSEPYWSPDGKELFFRTSTHLMTVPVSLEAGFNQTGQPVRLFETHGFLQNAHHTTYALLSDGQTFLFARNPEIAETRIVINWLDEVRARMGRE
jgi:serine/threonine protein kinase